MCRLDFVTGTLFVFSHPPGNELVPLETTIWLMRNGVAEILCRATRRSGMSWNLDELVALAQLPGPAVAKPKARTTDTSGKRAKMSEPGIYTVKEGKIVLEEFLPQAESES